MLAVQVRVFPHVLVVLSTLIFHFRAAWQAEANPSEEQSQGSFKTDTGISNLRDHLRKVHTATYWDAVTAKSWTVPRDTRPKVTTEAIAMLKGPSRLTFNEENFLRALVDFIVADDQVRIVSY